MGVMGRAALLAVAHDVDAGRLLVGEGEARGVVHRLPHRVALEVPALDHAVPGPGQPRGLWQAADDGGRDERQAHGVSSRKRCSGATRGDCSGSPTEPQRRSLGSTSTTHGTYAIASSVAMRIAIYGIIGRAAALRFTPPIWHTTTSSNPAGGTTSP